jgi:ribosome-associated translation inhibitor RaiA
VSAHGFDLTDAIRTTCLEEAQDKLMPLALHNFSTRWTLSFEAGEHVAHLSWTDGGFRGDVTVKTIDMYQSIHQASKKAHDQIKKSHEKRYSHKQGA